VVSDRISTEALRILNRVSVAWYDRRGPIRLVLPGLAVDTDVAQLLPPARVIDPSYPQVATWSSVSCLTPTTHSRPLPSRS
jgi:hypothetical protein